MMADTLERTNVVQHVFVVGLRNAHALEHQALALMDRQIDHLSHYPEVAQRLKAHRVETEGQIERLDEILHSLDESASADQGTTPGPGGHLPAPGPTVAAPPIPLDRFCHLALANFQLARLTM